MNNVSAVKIAFPDGYNTFIVGMKPAVWELNDGKVIRIDTFPEPQPDCIVYFEDGTHMRACGFPFMHICTTTYEEPEQDSQGDPEGDLGDLGDQGDPELPDAHE